MAKVLIIDDDTLVRHMLRSALRAMGYETLEAPTGETGVMTFKKSHPDIVITDLLMPDKNGLEAIHDIRALVPDVKIIAMSSGGADKNGSFLEMAEQLGALATLTKPFTIEDVQAALNKILVTSDK